MITELVSDDNNSYKLPLIKLVETKNMMVLTREEKRRLVLDLYNQGRTYREIAKEARISPRDIGIILRKAEQNNQRQQQEDLGRNDGKAAEPLDKTTQAYRLFSEGMKPIEVVVDLGLNGEETIRLYKEFWKLKHLNELYQIYPEIKHTLPSFLKLHKSLKR